MKKNIKFLILGVSVLIFSSCLNKTKELNRFKEGVLTYNVITDSCKIQYQIEVPKGGNIVRYPSPYNRLNQIYQVNYQDSSIFYLSDEIFDGNNLNLKNRFDNQMSGYTKENYLDTIDTEGIQINNKFWREKVCGYLVIGYLNSNKSKKSAFDKSISTIGIVQMELLSSDK